MLDYLWLSILDMERNFVFFLDYVKALRIDIFLKRGILQLLPADVDHGGYREVGHARLTREETRLLTTRRKEKNEKELVTKCQKDLLGALISIYYKNSI